MSRHRANPRERIGRVWQRVYERETRRIAEQHRLPAGEQAAFQAQSVAKINAIMQKAVRACERVMASITPKTGRPRKTR